MISKGWNQIDKFGHFYASYLESNVGYSLMKKFNFSEKQSFYMGGFQGLILETPIEFFDAYYEGGAFLYLIWLQMPWDLFFLFISRSYLVNKLIKPKLSFSRSTYARNANGLLVKITYSLSLYMIIMDIPIGFPFLQRGYSI